PGGGDTPSGDDTPNGGESGNGGGLVLQAQTHNAVMGTQAGLAALAAGSDFIGAAADGLTQAANIGADGISTFAQMGGGSVRQETGSHVDVKMWNAILALGHKNEKEKSTTQYGVFFEYCTGNYTTRNGAERGDGSVRYTGGGILAKWTAKHGFYVEGSFRAGTVKDDARNVMRDAAGAPYSYETSAGYWGAHLGLGKELNLGGTTLDIYGKYFCNRKNGVSFEAGGHYDLDAVTSSVLRVGARCTMKRDKWNLYGGLAYEHELDGKARGTAGGVPIRAADTGGGSVRAELGATFAPYNSPWSLDFNVTGFAGTKQGVTGGVRVAFMF
ncbi:MAG: autotransporter outer membrane beta-barrel domain-containing protein, partial [Schwartzia sp.]|nr:autotransporter outer membrane beta-barrel domain-containing protein [Schwartzia sp. (in: firmicutes)]